MSAPAAYHHGSAPGYPEPHPSSYHQQSMASANALPPIHHAQGYSSRDVSRHDVPSGFAVPSLGTSSKLFALMSVRS